MCVCVVPPPVPPVGTLTGGPFQLRCKCQKPRITRVRSPLVDAHRRYNVQGMVAGSGPRAVYVVRQQVSTGCLPRRVPTPLAF